MKLFVDSKTVALPVDATISIEKSSPLLNDDTGSFSYPFPVPTKANQHVLGWPGKLQRNGDIADQFFTLEENGLQIYRGEVDYDEVTETEIGVILKSGFTEFMGKMKGKMLHEIDYGSEWWPPTIDLTSSVYTKAEEWDAVNTNGNGKYVLTPFIIGDATVNTQDFTNAESKLLLRWDGGYFNYISLQFKVNFVIEKIFESAGYTIIENAIPTSVFNPLVVFGKIVNVFLYHIETGGLIVNTPFENEVIEYSRLMPDVLVLDFLDAVKNLLCIMYEIDERRKEVRITFKKDIFLAANLDGLQLSELQGWIHKEEKALEGFILRYNSQDNELDTHTEYPALIPLEVTLPTPEEEGKIVKSAYERYYITVKVDDESTLGYHFEWQEVGRLRECLVGEGEHVVELNVKVPPQKLWVQEGIDMECPYLSSLMISRSSAFTPLSFTAFTFYHGRKTFGTKSVPYASFDRYSLDGAFDTGISLKPAYLYDAVYTDILNWQTYRARAFTKYIKLTLAELIALQWGKRYVINGVEIILDKISYELPHRGIVKIEGFTA